MEKKSIFKVLIVVLAVGLTTLTATQLVLSDIVGSKHDFSTLGWSGGEICLPCHTPHNANATFPDAPLWNHNLSAAVYTVYSSPTMDVPVAQPGEISKLCLSCHDGTVALDSFGGLSGSQFISGAGNLTTDLSDDHPIGIEWTHPPNATRCTNCHIVHPWRFNDIVPFFDGKIECATCHDVHNTIGEPKLLRLPLAGSAICLYCHQI